MVKFYTPDDSVTRWVQPFEEHPEFKVEMRRLSEAETNRIYDRHKVFPNAPKQSMTRYSALVKDLFCQSIVSWEGAGRILGAPDDGVCTPENKLKIASVMVEHEVDGESVREPLAAILSARFSEMEAQDAKN